MKKLLLTSILLASACAVSAEITPVKVLEKQGIFRNTAMMVDDNGNASFKVALCDEDSHNSEVYISIYGDDLKLIKQMNFKGFNSSKDFEVLLIDFDFVIATYNWMVKNDKWCVVLYQSTGETDDWGYPVYKKVVVDEDGNVLGDLPFDNFEILLDHVTGGKPYAVCYGNEDEDVSLVYTFADNGQGGIAAVPVAEMKGYPNPLREGQTFTVELPRVADSKTVLVVTDMSGRQILRKPVENGSDRAVLRHSRLGHGQFIYTVIYGDGTAGSGKLLSE